MKKLAVFLVGIVLVGLLPLPSAFAQDDSPDAGVTPDSFLWVLDRAAEDVSVFFIFDDTKRAEKRLAHAQERLDEANALLLEKKFDAAAKAQRVHAKVLAKVQRDVKDIGNGDAEAELEKRAKIEERIAAQQEQIFQIKNRIEIKIKGDLTAEQQQQLEALLASFTDDTEAVSISLKTEKEKTKLKLRAIESEEGTKAEKELPLDKAERVPIIATLGASFVLQPGTAAKVQDVTVSFLALVRQPCVVPEKTDKDRCTMAVVLLSAEKKQEAKLRAGEFVAVGTYRLTYIDSAEDAATFRIDRQEPALAETSKKMPKKEESKTAKEPEAKSCAEDTMVCPDGSTVGRVPPKCDFAACQKAQQPTQQSPSETVPATTTVKPAS